MAWAKNGTPDTLTEAVTNLDITDLTALKFNVILKHDFRSGTNYASGIRIDNISTTTYSWRNALNGIEMTAMNNFAIPFSAVEAGDDNFSIGYMMNIATEEKLLIAFSVGRNSAGAGNETNRNEIVGKQVGTSVAFTSLSFNNFDTGEFQIDSNLSMLGTD